MSTESKTIWYLVAQCEDETGLGALYAVDCVYGDEADAAMYRDRNMMHDCELYRVEPWRELRTRDGTAFRTDRDVIAKIVNDPQISAEFDRLRALDEF